MRSPGGAARSSVDSAAPSAPPSPYRSSIRTPSANPGAVIACCRLRSCDEGNRAARRCRPSLARCPADLYDVVPAKAGTQRLDPESLGPRLRGGDDMFPHGLAEIRVVAHALGHAAGHRWRDVPHLYDVVPAKAGTQRLDPESYGPAR